MSSSKNPKNRKILKKTESNWIPDSRNFFKDVINDTLRSFADNGMLELSRTEQMSLANLQTLWMKKYDLQQRIPESTPAPCVVSKPAVRRPPRISVRKPAAKTLAPDEHYVDINTLKDDAKIIYRILVPRLRAQWPQCRSFDLKITAYVCKNNLIESLINWNLLDRIMQTPMEEATALFQSCIDNKLKVSLGDESVN